MSSAAHRSGFDRFFQQPLDGLGLVAAALTVWLGGAAYCHGLEQLLTGADRWSGSLLWSAFAVLPWFALFEWSKQPTGSPPARRPVTLIAVVLGIAALSLLVEYGINWCFGRVTDQLGLLVVRRLPAVAAALILIAMVRRTMLRPATSEAQAEIGSLAASIHWVEAADNYVELHLGSRVTLRRMTMGDAERALADRGFVRIHRRYLVNRSRIAAVTGGTDRRVRLVGGAEFPVGRRYAANLVG